MKARSQSARTEVFEEVGEKDAVPKEYALLEIRASIKTHTEGFYQSREDHVRGRVAMFFLAFCLETALQKTCGPWRKGRKQTMLPGRNSARLFPPTRSIPS